MNLKDKLLFYLMCAFIIIKPLIGAEIKLKGVPPSDALFGIIVIIYLVRVIFNSSARGKFINGLKGFFTSLIGIFMTILLAMMLTSTVYAQNKGLALSESVRFLTYIILYFLVKYEFNTKEVIKKLLKCYIFTTGILSVFGIVQHFTTIGLDKKYIVKYSSGYQVIKITSTMDNPNGYAAYLILIIFPLIMLTIYEKNKKNKILYGAISLLIFTNIIMTYSRNALIGLCIGACVLCILYSWKLIVVFGGLGVVSLCIPSVINRIEDITNTAQNESRIKLWKTAIMMIKENPILGVGNGNFVARYNEYVDKYKGLSYNAYRNYASHNSYLKVQSELGIIGITTFISILVTALLKVRKLYNKTKDKFYKPFYMGVMASFIAFYFMNILDHLFFVPKETIYFWFILATCEGVLETVAATEL